MDVRSQRKHFKQNATITIHLIFILLFYFITMTLLALPTEIIQLIGDRLDDAELNALAQVNRHMHKLLNDRLYYRDVIQPHSR